MSSFASTDHLPTYQQVLTSSQEQTEQYNTPYNSSIPMVPIVQTTTIKFGNQPVTMNCPYCGHTITTVIEQENGAIIFLLCILLALFGLLCGCCLIPFCISDLKDKNHFCPRCQNLIGKMTLF